MNSNIKATIKTLNDVTEILKDGEHGFKTAADDIKVSELAQLFRRYSEQRAQFSSELQARVIGLGASVEKTGSVSGALHRGWINIKAAVSSNEPHAVLEEAERGEDAAVDTYRKALENTELDLPTRELLSRQYTEVKAAHDKVKQLRDGATYRKAS